MRLISRVVFLVLVIINSGISAKGIPDPDIEFKWEQIDVPLKIDYRNIYLTGEGEGFITGKYILGLSNNSINILEQQPPTISIDAFFALSKKKIWTAQVLSTNESLFYYFNGDKWTQISSPLANQILAIYFVDDKHGWVGGDREIAYYNGKNWKQYPFPLLKGGVSRIYGINENDFWMMAGSNIYHYYQDEWHLLLRDASLFFESSKKTKYALQGINLYRFENDIPVICSVLPENKGISSVYVINDKNIWAAGREGTVFHYEGVKWESEKLPTEDNLFEIKFYSDTEGWVVGENGVVFHYTRKLELLKERKPGGFNPIRIFSSAKNLDQEYGVGIEDLNNDGLKDVITACMFAQNRLYINHSTINGNKAAGIRFTEEAAMRNITGYNNEPNKNENNPIYIGVGIADIDNDGNEDVYMCNLLGKNKLYLNDGEGYFEDVSDEDYRGVGENERTNSVAFADVNNDGFLDMFITNEESTNRLFINNGAGFFTEVTKEAGLETFGGGTSAAFCDINNDGKPDLFVSNWARKDILYRNDSHDGIIKFTDITEEAGIKGEPYEKSNSVCFADINNDGYPDLFITKRKSPNKLYLNDGTGHFKDVTKEYFGNDTMLSYGASFFDFDNDGYLDLYIANVGSNVLYRNINGKKFVKVTDEFNANMNGYCTGTAVGDIDNDGDIDLYVSSYTNGESVLFINNLNNKNFFTISVKGTISNRDAIGTKLWLYEHGHIDDKSYLRGYREINSGTGYCSHSSKEVHFGADINKKFDIVIVFPTSGIKKTLMDVTPGQHFEISEEEGMAAFFNINQKLLISFIYNANNQRKVLELFVFLFAIVVSIRFGDKRYPWTLKQQISIHSIVLGIYIAQILLFKGQNIFVAQILPAVSCLIIIILIHLIYERLKLLRNAKLERQAIRDRIARDLHDDLASTLSSTQIYTEVLKHSEPVTLKQSELLNKISVLLKDSTEAITDIIWNISPAHDNIDLLFMKLKILAIDDCRANSIKLTINENADNRNLIIPDHIKRNVFLIFKEAFNNVIKHASTEKVNIELSLADKHLVMIIEDFGKGIVKEEFTFDSYEILKERFQNEFNYYRNGIRNLFQRAKEINGNLVIKSIPLKGTKVTLMLKIT
jgi:signal transduction histidine kinase